MRAKPRFQNLVQRLDLADVQACIVPNFNAPSYTNTLNNLEGPAGMIQIEEWIGPAPKFSVGD